MDNMSAWERSRVQFAQKTLEQEQAAWDEEQKNLKEKELIDSFKACIVKGGK